MERIEQFNTTLHRLIIPLSELCPCDTVSHRHLRTRRHSHRVFM